MVYAVDSKRWLHATNGGSESGLTTDGELIGNIPLSTIPQEDYWAWNYEKSRIFSVRSAYRLLVTSRESAAWFGGRLSRSDVGAQEKEWTELWRTKVL